MRFAFSASSHFDDLPCSTSVGPFLRVQSAEMLRRLLGYLGTRHASYAATTVQKVAGAVAVP
jgi:hypothetical protein